MKKMFLYIMITIFFIACNFITEPKQKSYSGENMFEKIKQDTIKIEFGNQFILYWNCVNSKIIKEKNYYTILENKKNIRSIADFITNQDIVCNFVCNKETALKKGDVAYLFLSENMYIYEFKCLRKQFDVFDLDCSCPRGLLDYIEKNRDLVFQQVMFCLDNGGMDPR